jgi:thiol-disulfide isomerase/thioredoxin
MTRRAKTALGLGAAAAVAAVVVVSILTGGTVASNPCEASSTLVGTRVAAFHESGLAGGTVGAPWARRHGGVVIFFASWCGPCQREMPEVAAYLRAHPLGSVQVLGVDALDERGSARRFVAKDHVAFPVAFDPNGNVTTGIFNFKTLPETVFVDSSGRVAAVYYGAIPTSCLAADARDLQAA